MACQACTPGKFLLEQMGLQIVAPYLPALLSEACERAGWRQVRNFYGLAVEKFHQPSAAWHSSGHYIMAAAAAGWVFIFHVGSAKVNVQVPASVQNL